MDQRRYPIRIWSDSAIQSWLDGASRLVNIWGNVAGQLHAAGFDRKSKYCKLFCSPSNARREQDFCSLSNVGR